MDPDAVLSGLLAALLAKDSEQVDLLSVALLEWLKRAGFPPATVGPESLGGEWHKNIARFICLQLASNSTKFKSERPAGSGRECGLRAIRP